MERRTILTGAALSALAMAAGGCMEVALRPDAGGSAAPANATVASAAKGECYGVNSCKGTGECGGQGHSCAGQNSCKGQGWVTLAKADCDAKGGTFTPR